MRSLRRKKGGNDRFGSLSYSDGNPTDEVVEVGTGRLGTDELVEGSSAQLVSVLATISQSDGAMPTVGVKLRSL